MLHESRFRGLCGSAGIRSEVLDIIQSYRKTEGDQKDNAERRKREVGCQKSKNER